MSEQLPNQRLCFFIDGLDEYEGEHTDLADLLKVVGQASNVKICVSSRPRNVFESEFGGEQDRSLILQYFTQNDIRTYVTEKLGARREFRQLSAINRNAAHLVETILERAQGVFLWVFLVVKSLIRGLINADTIQDLERRLAAMPEDLEDYFRYMLNNNIEKIYHDASARMLLACIAAAEPLPLGVFDLLDGRYEAALDKSIDEHLKDLKGEDTAMAMIKRINARCTDLVEVAFDRDRTPGSGVLYYRVDFLHRTVRDFLRTRELYDILTNRLTHDFDAYYAIPRAYLLFERQIPPSYGQYVSLQESDRLTSQLMFYAREREKIQKKADDRLLDAVCAFSCTFRVRTGPDWASRFWEAVGSWGLSNYMEFALQYGSTSRISEYLRRVHINEALGGALNSPRNSILGGSVPAYMDSRMIATLLANGADPNWTFRNGNTPWKVLIKHLSLIWSSEKGIVPSLEHKDDLLNILIDLLVHGADYNIKTYVTVSDRGNRSVGLSDIVDGLFGGADRTRIETAIGRPLEKPLSRQSSEWDLGRD